MGTITHLLNRRGSILLLFVLATQFIFAQTYNVNSQASQLKVLGTSSLHDWEVVAEQQKGKIVWETSADKPLKELTFEVAAESLKSGKGAMDKNTYKALNTKQHKNISFKMLEVKEVKTLGNNKYKASINGQLTIAGTTKKMPLELEIQVNPGKIDLNGETKFKMTDFKIDPPKALLGTITTGDEVTIKFNTVFN